MTTLANFVPVPHDLIRHSYSFAPLFKSEVVAAKVVKTRCSPVPNLFGFCCPNTVIRLIVAVIVDALNAHSIRCFTHIGKKVVKAFPSVTHGYAAPTVVLKDVVVFVLASLAHPAPNVVSRSPRQPMPYSRAFCQKTAAGFGSASSDISAIALNNVAALASEAPDGTTTFPAAYALNGCESAKNHARHIEECHGCNSITNKRCAGVWTRQLERYKTCMELQS